MSASGKISAEEAKRVGEQIGIDWETVPFDVEQFRAGMDVELEHGTHDPAHQRHRRRPAPRARSPSPT